MFFLYRTRRKAAKAKDHNEIVSSWPLTPTPAEHSRLQSRVCVRQIAMSLSVRHTALRRSPSQRAKVAWLHLLVKLMHRGGGGVAEASSLLIGFSRFSVMNGSPVFAFSSPEPHVNYDSHSERWTNYTCVGSRRRASWRLSKDGCHRPAPFSFTSLGVVQLSAADLDELPFCRVKNSSA